MQPTEAEATQTQTEAAPPVEPKTLERTQPAASSTSPRMSLEHLILIPDPELRARVINEYAQKDLERQNYAQDLADARQFAVSGFFDDIKGNTLEQAIAKAMVKVRIGRSWGFSAADSIRHIYMANGRPSIENELVAAKLQQAGIDWDIEWYEKNVPYEGAQWAQCTGCRLWLKKWNRETQRYDVMLDRNGKPISVAFVKADADHAVIHEKGVEKKLSEKWNFQSWARDMYYWKCIARVKKYHAPHVLRGVLTKEELLETLPADAMPPSELPRDLQPAPAVIEAPKPATLREHLQGIENLSDAPPWETPGQMTLDQQTQMEPKTDPEKTPKSGAAQAVTPRAPKK